MAIWIILHSVLTLTFILFLTAVLRPLLPDRLQTVVKWATRSTVVVVSLSSAALTGVFLQTWPLMLYTNFYYIPHTPWTSLPVSITVTAFLFLIAGALLDTLESPRLHIRRVRRIAVIAWTLVTAAAIPIAMLVPAVWWLGIAVALIGGLLNLALTYC